MGVGNTKALMEQWQGRQQETINYALMNQTEIIVKLQVRPQVQIQKIVKDMLWSDTIYKQATHPIIKLLKLNINRIQPHSAPNQMSHKIL